MNLVLISGPLGSGKTTLANNLVYYFGGEIHSLANQLRKDLLPLVGDMGITTPEDMKRDPFKTQFRGVLQAYGQFRRSRNQNYWVNRLASNLLRTQNDFVFVDDVRFPNEVGGLTEASFVNAWPWFWIHLDTLRTDTYEYLTGVKGMTPYDAEAIMTNPSEEQARGLSANMFETDNELLIHIDRSRVPDEFGEDKAPVIDNWVFNQARRALEGWLREQDED